jgi:hypothetical protein
MIGLSLFLLAGAAVQAPDSDPLLPARSGQLQCYSPDTSRKICHALAAYELDGEGRYVNRAEIPLTADGSVTMTTRTPVRIVAGAVCGTVGQADIEAAEVRASGAPVPADRAALVLRQVAQSHGARHRSRDLYAIPAAWGQPYR